MRVTISGKATEDRDANHAATDDTVGCQGDNPGATSHNRAGIINIIMASPGPQLRCLSNHNRISMNHQATENWEPPRCQHATTDDTVGCQGDNPRCHQPQQSRHHQCYHGISRSSVTLFN